MFKNRIDTGKLLTEMFKKKISLIENLVVVGIARGGVPVASEIAGQLNKTLDVLSIKKISTEKDPEYALGAVSEEGDLYLDHNAIFQCNVGSEELKLLIDKFQKYARLESEKFMSDKRYVDYEGKSILLVDDGVATGATIQSAIMFLKKYNVESIYLAVPVCPKQAYDSLNAIVEDIYALLVPNDLSAISSFYEDFIQVSDDDIIDILSKSPNALSSKRINDHITDKPINLFHFY